MMWKNKIFKLVSYFDWKLSVSNCSSSSSCPKYKWECVAIICWLHIHWKDGKAHVGQISFLLKRISAYCVLQCSLHRLLAGLVHLSWTHWTCLSGTGWTHSAQLCHCLWPHRSWPGAWSQLQYWWLVPWWRKTGSLVSTVAKQTEHGEHAFFATWHVALFLPDICCRCKGRLWPGTLRPWRWHCWSRCSSHWTCHHSLGWLQKRGF